MVLTPNHPLEACRIDVGEGGLVGDAGVADDDVEPAVELGHSAQEGGDSVFVADVCSYEGPAQAAGETGGVG